jgi:hypothetical protein
MRALALGVAVLSSLVGFSSAYGQEKAAEAASVREQIQALQQRLIDLEKGDQAKRRITEIDPGKPRTRDHEGTGTLRAYDLNDLFAVVPQYPAKHPADIDGREELLFPAPANGSSGLTGTGGGMGGGFGGGGMGGSGGGGFFQVGSGQTATVGGMQASMIELISVIQETAPGPWVEVDGEGGTISTIGTTLLVRASMENHQQIERLLEVLRNTWGSLKLVNLEVDWLWLTGEELRTLAPVVRESAIRIVADDVLQSLRESQGQDDRPLGRSAQVTCYNGQTVNVQSLQQSLTVTSVTPIASTNTLGYTPQVRGLDHGTVAQVHPLVSRSGKFVVLDFHSRVNDVDPGDVATYDAVRPNLDRPTLLTHRLSTALRVPVGVPTLVGGMTHAPLDEDDGYTLCVFVQANVEDLKEAVEEESREEDGAEMSQSDLAPHVDADAKAEQKAAIEQLQDILELQNKLKVKALKERRQKLLEAQSELNDSLRSSAPELDDLKSRIELPEKRLDELQLEIEQLQPVGPETLLPIEIQVNPPEGELETPLEPMPAEPEGTIP